MICSYSDHWLKQTVKITGYGIVYDQYPDTEANGDPLKYDTALKSTSCMTNNQGPIEHHFQQLRSPALRTASLSKLSNSVHPTLRK